MALPQIRGRWKQGPGGKWSAGLWRQMVRCLGLPRPLLSRPLHTHSSLTLFPCPRPSSPSLSIQHSSGGPHISKDKLDRLAIRCIICCILYVEETKRYLILELHFRLLGGPTSKKKMQTIRDRHFSHFPNPEKKKKGVHCKVLGRTGPFCLLEQGAGLFSRLFLLRQRWSQWGLLLPAGCPLPEAGRASLVLSRPLLGSGTTTWRDLPLLPSVSLPVLPVHKLPRHKLHYFCFSQTSAFAYDPGLQITWLQGICPKHHKVLPLQFLRALTMWGAPSLSSFQPLLSMFSSQVNWLSILPLE